MPTKLNSDNDISRETAVEARGRTIVVTLKPRYMELRLKRSRQPAYILDYGAALDLAIKLAMKRESNE